MVVEEDELVAVESWVGFEAEGVSARFSEGGRGDGDREGGGDGGSVGDNSRNDDSSWRR